MYFTFKSLNLTNKGSAEVLLHSRACSSGEDVAKL